MVAHLSLFWMVAPRVTITVCCHRGKIKKAARFRVAFLAGISAHSLTVVEFFQSGNQFRQQQTF